MTKPEIAQQIETLLASRRIQSSLTAKSDIDTKIRELRQERTVLTKKRLVELEQRSIRQ